MKDFEEFLKAMTRPVISLVFCAVIAQVIIEGIDAPDWFIALAITTITWWFADRTREHIKGSKNE